MQQVSPHVWVETEYEGANVGCIVGERGIVLVESPMSPPDARDWLQKVRRVSQKPILYIVNTDHHFDHSICNCVFGAPSILHELALPGLQELRFTYKDIFKHFAAEKYAELKKDLEGLDLADPLITFSEKLTLELGDLSVKLVHVGGHSLGTIYVLAAEDKVLFTGDNVTHNRHPYMGEAVFANWRRGLDRMLRLDATVVVPGHGDVCGKEAITKLIEFLTLLEARVKEMRDAGKKRGHVVKQVAELVAFYPIVPGREQMIPDWVSDAMGRMFDELGG